MEKIRIATLQLLCVLTLTACGTTHKTYQPPDSTKLKASVARLNTAIKKSHSTAAASRTKVNEAITKNDEIKVESLALDLKLDELKKVAPAELQPQIEEIQKLREAQQQRQDEQEKILADAQHLNNQLAKENTEVVTAQDDVHKNGEQYLTDAQSLANNATEEREARITAESQLIKEKILKTLGLTGAIVFFVCLIGGLIMWKLGKLAIKL
jgi:TolA-binding protein